MDLTLLEDNEWCPLQVLLLRNGPIEYQALFAYISGVLSVGARGRVLRYGVLPFLPGSTPIKSPILLSMYKCSVAIVHTLGHSVRCHVRVRQLPTLSC